MDYRKIYGDDSILVIEKPAGVEITQLPFQPAHRLDKDTSGLLVVAKNDQALKNLQAQFKNRQVKKEYIALVLGDVQPNQGEIVTKIVRDPSRRVPFKAIEVPSGLERGSPRIAKTRWQVLKNFSLFTFNFSILRITIATGRTHQIRVHMKYLGWPLVGDMVYCNKTSKAISKRFGLTRQFLHATKLQIQHPVTRKLMTFESELPNELKQILNSKS